MLLCACVIISYSFCTFYICLFVCAHLLPSIYLLRAEDDLSQEKAKWEKFREEVAIVEKEMLEVLSQHEKNPEKHPKYPEEWKLFWNKRYKVKLMNPKRGGFLPSPLAFLC